MALILCIETGTDVCSVGIARDGELLSLRESDEGRDHAKKVGVFVDELLRETAISPDDLDAVAKGLCYGTGKPLIAVNSLASLAEVAREDYEAGIIDVEKWDEALLCPMVDARRMEVYAQVFDTAGKALSEVSAEVVTAESFAQYRHGCGEFVIFGSGAAKCAEVLDDAVVADVVPSVRGMVSLAEQAFVAGDFVDVAYFEPFYLKNFVVTTSKKRFF